MVIHFLKNIALGSLISFNAYAQISPASSLPLELCWNESENSGIIASVDQVLGRVILERKSLSNKDIIYSEPRNGREEYLIVGGGELKRRIFFTDAQLTTDNRYKHTGIVVQSARGLEITFDTNSEYNSTQRRPNCSELQITVRFANDGSANGQKNAERVLSAIKKALGI